MENIPIDLNVREDKPAFNIDRLLSIHQSYSLEGIKRLNVEMLKAQYAQCEQLTQLQKQIDQGNKISMQILRNQIREIENRERQKFYKAMVFNLAMFCDHIRRKFQMFWEMEEYGGLYVIMGNRLWRNVGLEVADFKSDPS